MIELAELAKRIPVDDVREVAMVDLAYDILREQGEAMLFRDLLEKIVQLKGFSDEETNHYIAQLYTEINIDGRFVCVGKSLWGLKQWYPIEQATDSAVVANVKDDLEEEVLDDEEDEEENEIDESEEEYEDLYAEDVEEDVEIDDLEDD